MSPVMLGTEIVIAEDVNVDGPRIAASKDRFTVIWSRPKAAAPDILAATYDRNGKRLVAPAGVDESAGDIQSFQPDIDVSADGSFWAGLWSINNGLDAGARYEGLGKSGRPNASPEPLSPDPDPFDPNTIKNSGNRPVIAGLAPGGFVAAWGDFKLDGFVSTQVLMTGRNGGGETVIDTDSANTNTLGLNTRIEGLSGGGYAVAWRRSTGAFTADNVLQAFTKAGAPSGSRRSLPRVYGRFGDYVHFGDLAHLPGNGILYAWKEQNPLHWGANAYFDTFLQRYTGSGTPVGRPLLVNEAVESQVSAERDIAVSAFADGRAVVVWSETRVRDSFARSRDVIMGQLVSAAGKPVGHNFEVATDPDFSSLTDVDVATLGKTNFVVSYRHDLGNGSIRIVARRFSTDDTGVTRTGAGTIRGTEKNDTLTGSAGKDTLLAGAGDDILDGAGKGDRLDGGAGSDTARYKTAVKVNLATGAGGTGAAAGDSFKSVENITGSPLGDTLTGDGEMNVIDGGAGNDTINGGGRSDMLTGGKGKDTFVVSADTDIDDTLLDFKSGEDKLVVEKSGFSGFTMAAAPGFAKGTLPAADFSNTFSFFFDTGLRRLYYNIGSAWIEFARLPNTTSMAAGDISVR